ncbi:MAG TPA: TonB-dependent receptor, partial [Cyclobacteriaceae bacterium]
MKKVILFFLICGSLTLSAQDILQFKLDGTEQGKTLTSVLSEIEKKNGARFYFLSEWIEQISFQESYKGETLGEALNDLFSGTDLRYFSMYPHAVVIIKDPTQPLLRQNAIATAVRQQKKIEPRVIGDKTKSKKGKIAIRGVVIDAKTKEPMARTSIQVKDTAQYGTTTDESGRYSLSVSPGAHVLSFSFIDHEDKIIDLTAYSDGELNIEMDEMPILLDEVVIQYQAARELTTTRIGQTQITMKEIKRAPAMLGEADLIKQVQVLPGVTTVGEAASGFNVRGGSVDQNLILYDGMPVFNSSHVFGFLSAFNSEAIRDVSFFRGGIPAEYGGRVSSVLDIHSKDGDFKKWNGNAGIGMITSNVMINGPLKTDKTSLSASLRSTYSNWLIHQVKTNYADLSKSSVFFYDGAIKLAHMFSNNTKLAITGYSSQDAFRLVGDTTYRWNNLQLSGKLDHQFSSVLNAEFIGGVSSYGYNVENSDYRSASRLSFRITSTVLKAGFNYQRGIHKLNFGWQLTHYQFKPGNLEPKSPESTAKNLSLDKQYSIENAFYIADEWPINTRLTAEGGVRLPLFVSFGPASVNVYKEGAARDIANVTDTLHFKTLQPIKAYLGFEPRLSFRWMVNTTASVKLGYNRMYQYLQLVTNTTAVTPVDIWQP